MSFIKNLKYRENNFELNIPAWEILDHGITVLWGPSGAGKSTLLRVLLGLENGFYSWIISDQDIGPLATPEKMLGVVFQNYELFPHMSAENNVKFAMTARGIKYSSQNKSINNKRDLQRFCGLFHCSHL